MEEVLENLLREWKQVCADWFYHEGAHTGAGLGFAYHLDQVGAEQVETMDEFREHCARTGEYIIDLVGAIRNLNGSYAPEGKGATLEDAIYSATVLAGCMLKRRGAFEESLKHNFQIEIEEKTSVADLSTVVASAAAIIYEITLNARRSRKSEDEVRIVTISGTMTNLVFQAKGNPFPHDHINAWNPNGELKPHGLCLPAMIAREQGYDFKIKYENGIITVNTGYKPL